MNKPLRHPFRASLGLCILLTCLGAQIASPNEAQARNDYYIWGTGNIVLGVTNLVHVGVQIPYGSELPHAWAASSLAIGIIGAVAAPIVFIAGIAESACINVSSSSPCGPSYLAEMVVFSNLNLALSIWHIVWGAIHLRSQSPAEANARSSPQLPSFYAAPTPGGGALLGMTGHW